MPNACGLTITIVATVAGIKPMHVDEFDKDASAAGSTFSSVNARDRRESTSHPIGG
jgi:hypothetical protein